MCDTYIELNIPFKLLNHFFKQHLVVTESKIPLLIAGQTNESENRVLRQGIFCWESWLTEKMQNNVSK